MMDKNVKLHPLQAKGQYYVDCNVCTCSAACVEVAPHNFRLDDDGAYVVKQPETMEEFAQCDEAIWSCPVEAILKDGDMG